MGSPPSREPSYETYHRGRKWVSPAAAGLPVAVTIVVAFLRWKPFRVEVEGASMLPTLLPGDWALAVGARKLKRGDVIVVEHPGRSRSKGARVRRCWVAAVVLAALAMFSCERVPPSGSGARTPTPASTRRADRVGGVRSRERAGSQDPEQVDRTGSARRIG